MSDSEKTVLIVDDDVSFLSEMMELLRDFGYHALGASSSRQALALARKSRPDIILLDLKLGATSGFQLALQLRHLPETAAVPIIGMTGYFNVGTCGRMISHCRIDACLQKPMRPREVVEAIEQATVAAPAAALTTDHTNGRGS